MHTAEYYQGRIYVFRGGDGQLYLNDLHSLDLTTNEWRKEKLSGIIPTPRANHTSTMIKHNMYIYGGWDG
jgi:N-acetylneuraminic acid mutarotase